MLDPLDYTGTEPVLNRDSRDISTNWTNFGKSVERHIGNLAKAVHGNDWGMVLEGIFDVPIPKHFSGTLSHQSKETGDIMKVAYTKFKEKLLEYHKNGELEKALRNNRIFWSFGNSPEKLRMNLDYYEDLLHGKVQRARDWATQNGIRPSVFTGRNQGFLVSILRPNWPLFEDCLHEVLQEKVGAIGEIEDTTRKGFTQALV